MSGLLSNSIGVEAGTSSPPKPPSPLAKVLLINVHKGESSFFNFTFVSVSIIAPFDSPRSKQLITLVSKTTSAFEGIG